MSKTSTDSTASVNQVDPTMRAESSQLLDALKSLIGYGQTPINTAPTIAAFTPTQEAAFAMQDSAANAFGFTPAADSGLPEAEMSELGIMGYSPGKEAQSMVDALDPAYKAAVDSMYKQASAPIEDEAPDMPDTDGGKKGGKK